MAEKQKILLMIFQDPKIWDIYLLLLIQKFLSEIGSLKEMQKNIKIVKKLPKAKGFSNILYPGERKNKTYKKNLNKDISIPMKILREMEKLNAK